MARYKFNLDGTIDLRGEIVRRADEKKKIKRKKGKGKRGENFLFEKKKNKERKEKKTWKPV